MTHGEDSYRHIFVSGVAFDSEMRNLSDRRVE